MENVMIGPITFTYEELLKKREAGVSEKLLETLKTKADGILHSPVANVTMRTLRAPSGDPKDYMSLGTYWWPNPNTPDGLPYVRRDGEGNPAISQPVGIGTPFGRTFNLALAAFYLGDPDKKYSDYANRQLRAWFIDEETRMNPNARYAQAIPGICDGRGIGLIDFAQAYRLFDGMGILECMGLLPEDTLKGVRAWYNEFLDWMLTHEQGYEANIAANNHGTWFDAHVLSAAVALNRTTLAKKICDTSYDLRTKRQIAPDGSQAHELARTIPLTYSCFNLEAFFVIANIADRLGYKRYWSADEEIGEPILKRAIDFLLPFIKDPDSCPYPQIKKNKSDIRFSRELLRLDARCPGNGYKEIAYSFGNLEDDLETLLPLK